jgi:hypothetical protein
MKNFSIYLSVLFLLYGAQHGTAQDDHAPLLPVKKNSDAPKTETKSDASKTVAFKDPSHLEGFQIRPPFSSLKVRQKQLLKMKYCQRYSADYVECDFTGNDLGPILPAAKTSKWSVNGIEGGDDRVGKIVANDRNTATYTAPAIKPVEETVQVSAEVEADGADKSKGKTLVVAAITIWDDEPKDLNKNKDKISSYYGTVQLNYNKDGIRYQAYGILAFKESSPNSNSFESYTGKLIVIYILNSTDCKASYRGIVPFYAELHTQLEAENDYRLGISSDLFDINCQGYKIPAGIPGIIAPMDGTYGRSDDDFTNLWGNTICADIKVEWTIVKR